MVEAFLSLGSNTGDRVVHLQSGLNKLAAISVQPATVSAIYETEHVGETSAPKPRYLNCIVRVTTEMAPMELLQSTQAFERAEGRIPGPLWAPRPLDIDIALYGAVVLHSEQLTIPHPRLCERAFVLRPLLELAGDIVVPGADRVSTLLELPAVTAQKISRWPAELGL